MTLTGLVPSTSTGLVGSHINAFFEDLEEKKLRNLERRFDGLGQSVGLTGGKGYSPGLMWWRVVLTRVRRDSSYCGLTIEFTRQRKTSVEDEINPHLRRAHMVHHYWLASLVLCSVHRTSGWCLIS